MGAGHPVSPEPRFDGDYSDRQVAAARRVLVDVGQILAAFHDAIVVVGGWVPDLLLPASAHLHVGSIDVDLALDARRLGGGRYAELLKLLLDSRRYELGPGDFRMGTWVDLADGQGPIHVDVEFLASSEVKLTKNHPKRVDGFRVLQFAACEVAFRNPQDVEVDGEMISGASNSVRLQVASLPDFLILKAHAVRGRDKPKDVYDICYCLDEFPDAVTAVADDWRARRGDPFVDAAVEILREKFMTVDHYGPQQLAVFHQSGSPDDGLMHARRAFELVQRLLSLQQVGGDPSHDRLRPRRT
jgi:hypothetical protein